MSYKDTRAIMLATLLIISFESKDGVLLYHSESKRLTSLDEAQPQLDSLPDRKIANDEEIRVESAFVLRNLNVLRIE